MKQGQQSVAALTKLFAASSRDYLLAAGKERMVAWWPCPKENGGTPPSSPFLQEHLGWATAPPPPRPGHLLPGPLPPGSFEFQVDAVWKASSSSHELGSQPLQLQLQSNRWVPVMRCCSSASGDDGMLPFCRAGLPRHFRNGAETEQFALQAGDLLPMEKRSSL